MAKSIAKADALQRDLKERLEQRGFLVSESRDAEGWKKLSLNTNEASIRIEAEDMVSKDIFGNDNVAFAPHFLDFSSRDDAMDSAKVAKILIEVYKMGVSKTHIRTHATSLASAEAAAPSDSLEFDEIWKTKGI
jgi:hypothetical protein